MNGTIWSWLVVSCAVGALGCQPEVDQAISQGDDKNDDVWDGEGFTFWLQLPDHDPVQSMSGTEYHGTFEVRVDEQEGHIVVDSPFIAFAPAAGEEFYVQIEAQDRYGKGVAFAIDTIPDASTRVRPFAESFYGNQSLRLFLTEMLALPDSNQATVSYYHWLVRAFRWGFKTEVEKFSRLVGNLFTNDFRRYFLYPLPANFLSNVDGTVFYSSSSSLEGTYSYKLTVQCGPNKEPCGDAPEIAYPEPEGALVLFAESPW